MQGTRGQIRTGGDDGAGAELQGSPPTQKPLALYSGIVRSARRHRGGRFDIPEFAGTARVMAVAWSATKASARPWSTLSSAIRWW
jgi:uncharacterized protein YfaS (alpha-2-macroglobulin family)